MRNLVQVVPREAVADCETRAGSITRNVGPDAAEEPPKRRQG